MDEMFVEALTGFGQFFLICSVVAIIMMLVHGIKSVPRNKE